MILFPKINEICLMHTFRGIFLHVILKVAIGVCFELKSWKEYLLLFTHLITLGKDVVFPLITKSKKKVSELFICKSNTELKCCLTD